MPHPLPPLPIDAVLPDIQRALAQVGAAVLVAPPGAGKTTRVPLALLDQAWRAGRKILVLEPRRIAARGAADQMARLLGESVGQTIGLRARLASKVGPKTRIEVITEGVFTRMILDDPALDGVGAVLFDEFHERSLDTDLGLALALDARAGLRDDLRLLVMSATLDAGPVARLLGDAAVIASEGRAFPVETRYLGRRAEVRIEDQMVDAILTALRDESGSILAFLPGQGEIRRVHDRLAERLQGPAVDICPLYGALSPADQDRAISPALPDRRKVVLATSIAETSLTIEGVRIVIDCGLARVPRFEPDIAITRLETVRASRAAADQRRGRAGRTEPGVAYRLWDEPQTMSLQPFAEPEIRSADLTGLLLDCAAWGVTDPATLPFLDPPPRPSLDAARAELAAIGAIDRDGRLTDEGRRVRDLPLPPRLARMILAAAQKGDARLAADIAAVMVERGIGGTDSDLETRLQAFRRDRSARAEDMRSLARGWAEMAGGGRSSGGSLTPAAALALAYPDRLAKARGATGQFLLANGRGAIIDQTDALAREPFLVVAELQGGAQNARILLAARLAEAALRDLAADRITTSTEITFDRASASLRARRIERLDALTLNSDPLPVPTGEGTAATLAQGLAGLGLARLPWSKAQAQLRDRVAFLRAADPKLSELPDVSDDTLAASAEGWLAPHLNGKRALADVTADDLGAALDALLPWAVRQRIEAEAPTHFTAPTGERHPIDYDGEGAPALDIRVQELFGLKTHPAIAGGRRPLTLRLLSPARRPIQITRDLPGFWAGSWNAVKADMKGQYPRHPWPDDPANAMPTTRAKPRA